MTTKRHIWVYSEKAYYVRRKQMWLGWNGHFDTLAKYRKSRSARYNCNICNQTSIVWIIIFYAHSLTCGRPNASSNFMHANSTAATTAFLKCWLRVKASYRQTNREFWVKLRHTTAGYLFLFLVSYSVNWGLSISTLHAFKDTSLNALRRCKNSL